MPAIACDGGPNALPFDGATDPSREGGNALQVSNFGRQDRALNKPLARPRPSPGRSEATISRREGSVVVKKLQPVPVEAIARGYLIGSGWKDYQATGAVCGIVLPKGLRQAQILPEPMFTPSTKAAPGAHDQNVSYDSVVAAIGGELAGKVRDATLAIYRFAAAYAAQRGIIIADTKLEFGLDEDGQLHVMDEMLTPDSSRSGPPIPMRQGSVRELRQAVCGDYLETLG